MFSLASFIKSPSVSLLFNPPLFIIYTCSNYSIKFYISSFSKINKKLHVWIPNKPENTTQNAKRQAPSVGGCRIDGYVWVKKVTSYQIENLAWIFLSFSFGLSPNLHGQSFSLSSSSWDCKKFRALCLVLFPIPKS